MQIVRIDVIHNHLFNQRGFFLIRPRDLFSSLMKTKQKDKNPLRGTYNVFKILIIVMRRVQIFYTNDKVRTYYTNDKSPFKGGLVCRGLLSTIPDHNVDTLIAVSSPMAGIYGGLYTLLQDSVYVKIPYQIDFMKIIYARSIAY